MDRWRRHIRLVSAILVIVGLAMLHASIGHPHHSSAAAIAAGADTTLHAAQPADGGAGTDDRAAGPCGCACCPVTTAAIASDTAEPIATTGDLFRPAMSLPLPDVTPETLPEPPRPLA